MDFKNIPNKYRPIPSWNWNEELDTDETKIQIRKMQSVGIGGFFMHTMSGLQTEYMDGEWFRIVDACIDEAGKYDVGVWPYCENGWPNGFGNSTVKGKGVNYQQKYLRYEKEPKHTETFICKIDDLYFYYDVNPFYVDTLDRNAVSEFIKCTYEPYYRKYKNKIEGFFADELQISTNGIPWSFVIADEYKARYNDNLLSHLDALYFEVDGYKQIRVNFWKMVTDLFSSAYMKQIYDWCGERNLKLTGHLVCEDTFLSQLTSNGACMPHYEYFHVPGMEWHGRDLTDGVMIHQLGSVAQQLGKKQVMSENLALRGNNMSVAEFKGMYEWQMARGVNLLCRHLQGYSLRGIRKRDYNTSIYHQQPWWSEYKRFVDAMSRESMILTEGEIKPEILVIHPQTTAWTLYDCGENKGIDEKFLKFANLIKELEEKHVPFHLGDETIMERHARVNKDRIEIGCQSYRCVICAECDILLPSTEMLLAEFKTNGGVILDSAISIVDNPVISDKDITYTLRENSEYKIHFFTNTSTERKQAEIFVNGLKIDAETGELSNFNSPYEFEPWGSLMVLETEDAPKMPLKESEVRLSGIFKVEGEVENSITLDKCDYYFNGELQERDGYVLNISKRANEREELVKIHQDYFVNVNFIPEKIYLVCETPEIFKISVNGKEIEFKYEGYFRDVSFKKIDIAKYLINGKNTISFDCDFVQSDRVYENIRNSKIFKNEKNKICYDMEIEAIYLVGDFSVETEGKWSALNRNTVLYNGGFAIEAPKKEITLSNIEQQGFPFFSGELTVKGTLDVLGKNPYLMLDKRGINAVRIRIGENVKVSLTDEKIPLSDIAENGRNEVEITLINNLRNLLGPHHLIEGENYRVCPETFYKEKCIRNYTCNQATEWNDGYSFAETGLC